VQLPCQAGARISNTSSEEPSDRTERNEINLLPLSIRRAAQQWALHRGARRAAGVECLRTNSAILTPPGLGR
jgi:hypothetical protein